jgi:choline kinase
MTPEPIKCAVVLAAGFGSRLRANDPGLPKPLQRIRSVPMLVRVLRSLAAAGIERFVVVLGHEAQLIRASLEAEAPRGLDISFVFNPHYDKSNGVSLLAAREYVTEPCVLSMADHLYSSALVETVMRADCPREGCVLGVDYDIARCFDLDDATKVMVRQQRIVDIAKTLERYNALDTGVFRVGPSLIEELSVVYERKGDCSLSDGVRSLAQKGLFFARDVGDAQWIDVDTPEAARRATEMLDWFGENLDRPVAPLPLAAQLPGFVEKLGLPRWSNAAPKSAGATALFGPSDAE